MAGERTPPWPAGYIDAIRAAASHETESHFFVSDQSYAELGVRFGSRKPGLGDMVAAGLSAVGITEKRAQAVASAVGVTDCGCGRRRAALNRIGRRLGIGS